MRPHDEQMGVYSDNACIRATMGYSSSSELNEVMDWGGNEREAEKLEERRS